MGPGAADEVARPRSRGAPLVLGISAFFHDSAAALVDARSGAILGALQQERLSRVKNDAAFPRDAIFAVLAQAGASLADVALVTYHELPMLHAERVLHSQLRFAPQGWRAFPQVARALLGDKLRVEQVVADSLGYSGPVLLLPHHLSHAASAYLPSPFDDAALLVVDAVGEWAVTSLGVGRAGRVTLTEEQRFPHSLGLFYSTLAAWAGFRVNSGEYKLMGLAPYGRPRFAEALRSEVIDVAADGGVRLNLRYFDFPAGLAMGSRRLADVLGPPRPMDGVHRDGRIEPLGEREADLAASAQVILEEALVSAARRATARAGTRSLCMAGGVALNCVAVARILEAGAADAVFVCPAAGDAGGALGAALLGAQALDPARSALRPARPGPGRDALAGALLGPAATPAELEAAVQAAGLRAHVLADAALDEAAAELLASGGVLGWYQGRAEFGPRSLGARSILADPRGADVADRVNTRIKQRERFRPFAPAVLEDQAAAWFDVAAPAPYMTRTAQVRGFAGATAPAGTALAEPWTVHAPLPAVTHVDGSARLQTVSPLDQPRFAQLLTTFQRRTGCPVLLNTSFNLRGEPVVGSPADAIATFAHSALDALALGPYWVVRAEQAPDTLGRIPAPRTQPD